MGFNLIKVSIFNILLSLTIIGSIIFYVFVVRRVMNYCKKYNFPELTYNKLFGIFKKRHFLITYAFFIFGQTIFTIWFMWTL